MSKLQIDDIWWTVWKRNQIFVFGGDMDTVAPLCGHLASTFCLGSLIYDLGQIHFQHSSKKKHPKFILSPFYTWHIWVSLNICICLLHHMPQCFRFFFKPIKNAITLECIVQLLLNFGDMCVTTLWVPANFHSILPIGSTAPTWTFLWAMNLTHLKCCIVHPSTKLNSKQGLEFLFFLIGHKPVCLLVPMFIY